MSVKTSLTESVDPKLCCNKVILRRRLPESRPDSSDDPGIRPSRSLYPKTISDSLFCRRPEDQVRASLQRPSFDFTFSEPASPFLVLASTTQFLEGLNMSMDF